MTEPTPPDTDGDLAFDGATIATLEALEDALDALRAHDELIPEWEVCEGFMPNSPQAEAGVRIDPPPSLA